MAIETTPWDVTEVLNSDEMIAAYLEEVFEDGDPARIAAALGAIVRVRDISVIARATDLTREALDSALSAGGNPTLSTVMAVVKALGFQLSVKPARIRQHLVDPRHDAAERSEVAEELIHVVQSTRIARYLYLSQALGF